MDKLKICSLVVVLASCSQPPDFTKDVAVKSKSSYASGEAIYTLHHDDGVRCSVCGVVLFKAPVDFADVGDLIQYIDGKLVATPRAK